MTAPPEPGGAALLGFDGSRAARPAAGSAPDLRATGQVLPELEPEAEKRRRLWRHPAFIVSMATTLIALIAAVVLLVMGAFGGQSAITQMGIDRTSGNVRVHWVGTGEPVELYAIGGPSAEVLDLTQTVTGDEAWIPLGALVIDDSTCLVVRPAAADAAEPTADGKPAPRVEVTNDAGALAEQRGASVCVADAVDLALPDADEDE
ncbi:hypothetical protein [Salinibacterium sp. ZJ77]|uniref:hypothetical protein n=1 Tax=Salinibacterium sp. ZJ77 TaxID=2708337 RepID=UPI001423A4C7|nr:hypothetical protein [Salinibacterium sp. ZJ77]